MLVSINGKVLENEKSDCCNKLKIQVDGGSKFCSECGKYLPEPRWGYCTHCSCQCVGCELCGGSSAEKDFKDV